ncbi:endonuclease/exonuclease/phosphatase family protein [Flavobacterium sp. DG1-102-2]|uniref:endonuclease/exonuclease/phosphatase family protein n=1 Tax=Flavobacterium sp. DG1-102-2 TaxID=3081663 RepID=UPI002949E3EA|nr:endonuclease/exonuclease/phosphatase family protein [Flavobacterium sp. DG1-102-2]MDV6166831.1 endonuclease/exonuclease/phosphatase family protein [Flavobacterium sp. DG1-102-2]
MKRLIVSALCFLAFANADAQNVKVMSYNIRLDVSSDGENRWDNRKDMLAAQVIGLLPDFMGVQEALPQQMDYLEEYLKNYDYIGVGRDDGKRAGEFSAIFYNSSKYKVLQQSTFWLSETPETPSFGWDAACRRVCTYGLFENIKTKQKIWAFNTHFDHIGNLARVNASKMILAKIKELNTQNLPFILTGDFNLEDTSESVKVLSAELGDSRKIAKKVSGPEATFNDFKVNEPAKIRIDYVFVPKTGVEVKEYRAIQEVKSGRYPSDHFPLYVELKIKK